MVDSCSICQADKTTLSWRGDFQGRFFLTNWKYVTLWCVKGVFHLGASWEIVRLSLPLMPRLVHAMTKSDKDMTATTGTSCCQPSFQRWLTPTHPPTPLPAMADSNPPHPPSSDGWLQPIPPPPPHPLPAMADSNPSPTHTTHPTPHPSPPLPAMADSNPSPHPPSSDGWLQPTPPPFQTYLTSYQQRRDQILNGLFDNSLINGLDYSIARLSLI